MIDWAKSIIAQIIRRKWLAGSSWALVLFFGLTSAEGWANRRSMETYAGCYTDWDGFILAMGADMRTYRRYSGKRVLPEYLEMANAAYAMHRKGVKWRGRGWLLQPGAYADHPDFAFAGASGTTPKVDPPLVRTIAWDSSHFSRWALWLSIYEESETNEDRRNYWSKLRQGLARQFTDKVLVSPNSSFRTYRLNNYMDGRNGFYRWNSKTLDGIRPYEHSITFALSWWSFLEDADIAFAYRHVSAALPFSPAEKRTYFGTVNRIDNAQAKFLTHLAAMGPDDAMGEAEKTERSRYGPQELSRELWVGDLAQSSYLDLMVPMHIAFNKNVPEWQSDFSKHFLAFRYFEDRKSTLFNEVNYLSFASRFMALAAQAGRADLIPQRLPNFVERRLLELWNGSNQSVSQTGWGEPRFNGFKPYLEWKHGQPCPNR